MNLSEILNSGLTFTKSENGKLKIAGNPQTISDLKADIVRLKPLVMQWLDERAKLQPRGAIEKTPDVSEHAPDETKRLLEMAVMLEAEADAGGFKFARAELRRLLTAANDAEHSGDKQAFDMAVKELGALMA